MANVNNIHMHRTWNVSTWKYFHEEAIDLRGAIGQSCADDTFTHLSENKRRPALFQYLSNVSDVGQILKECLANVIFWS